MTMPRLVKPADPTRADQITEVVKEALTAYRDVLNSKIDIRSVIIDIKMRQDGRGARVAVVTVQGGLEFTIGP